MSSEDIDRFRRLVAERLGLWFDNGHLEHLTETLRHRLHKAASHGTAAYLDRLRSNAESSAEWRHIANELTVPETYFFRYPEQFEAFSRVVLPERIKAGSSSRRLRILSAGCASGEEPYSLAILVAQALSHEPGWSVEILGIDVNTALLEKAAEGRYSEWSLRATAEPLRQAYFRRKGCEYTLDESSRSAVTFEHRNVVQEAPEFWQPDSFDIIFFRNVSIYFAPETTRGVIERIARALVSGGYLFLGPSETLRGVSRRFHLCHSHGTFYYQRLTSDVDDPTRPYGEVAPARQRPGPPSRSTQPLGIPALSGRDFSAAPSWVDEIGRAAERITELTNGMKRPPPEPFPAVAASAAQSINLEKVHELLKGERFSDALAALGPLLPEGEGDPDTLLLRAVLLTNAGRIAEAESVCRRVLAFNELDAGAHYVAALCREHAGDRLGAAEHDETAIYLDAAFAMPRVHLGMLARRAGDLAIARLELQAALELLGQEQSSRLLLFGGGFTREALVQLCRAELRNCGEAP